MTRRQYINSIDKLIKEISAQSEFILELQGRISALLLLVQTNLSQLQKARPYLVKAEATALGVSFSAFASGGTIAALCASGVIILTLPTVCGTTIGLAILSATTGALTRTLDNKLTQMKLLRDPAQNPSSQTMREQTLVSEVSIACSEATMIIRKFFPATAELMNCQERLTSLRDQCDEVIKAMSELNEELCNFEADLLSALEETSVAFIVKDTFIAAGKSLTSFFSHPMQRRETESQSFSVSKTSNN